MSERTEWPTRAKLERLREEGIVPYSRAATACFVAAASAFAAAGWSENWVESLAAYQAAVDRGAAGLAGAAFWADAVKFSVALLGAAAAAAAVSILAQTRVFFRPGLAAVRFERLNPFAGLSLSAMVRRLARAFGAAAAGIILAGVVVRALFRDMAGLLNHGIDYLLEHAGEAVPSSLSVIGGAMVLAGLAAAAASRAAFRFQHRMTRAEVLRDQGDE